MSVARAWSNWSGSVRVQPRTRARPRDEAEVAAQVSQAHAEGRRVRAVATGHSSHEMLRADDVLLDMRGLRGVVRAEREALRATVRPGTRLQALGKALYARDLALPNYGDVATQTLGGAIGTGTHGTGPRLRNLSDLLTGARFVDGRGQVRTLQEDDLPAARVALGSLGIFTELEVRLVPAFDVERREFAFSTDAGLETFDEFSRLNRSVDFYWYPRRDDLKLRIVNPVGGGHFPAAKPLIHTDGYGHQIIPTHSGIPHLFEECEYALPAERGLDCFRAVRRRMLQRWRASVGWRVLYRTVAADEAWLSPAYGRATATISLHQNSTLPWREFFDDIEPIFREFDGRPHWAKKHTLRGAALAARYPRWDDFHAVRRRLDPDGTFLTPPLRALFGEDA